MYDIKNQWKQKFAYLHSLWFRPVKYGDMFQLVEGSINTGYHVYLYSHKDDIRLTTIGCVMGDIFFSLDEWWIDF